MPDFIVMVGLPGSGKSYVTEVLQANRCGARYEVLSTDAIVERMAEELGTTYNEIWKDAIGDATKHFNTTMRAHIERMDNIIVDQTNLGVKKRKALLAPLNSLWHRIAVVVVTADYIREQRLWARTDKNISEGIIQSMKASYVEPTFDEGFDEIRFVKGY